MVEDATVRPYQSLDMPSRTPTAVASDSATMPPTAVAPCPVSSSMRMARSVPDPGAVARATTEAAPVVPLMMSKRPSEAFQTQVAPPESFAVTAEATPFRFVTAERFTVAMFWTTPLMLTENAPEVTPVKFARACCAADRTPPCRTPEVAASAHLPIYIEDGCGV